MAIAPGQLAAPMGFFSFDDLRVGDTIGFRETVIAARQTAA
jgi:hypothetical protein